MDRGFTDGQDKDQVRGAKPVRGPGPRGRPGIGGTDQQPDAGHRQRGWQRDILYAGPPAGNIRRKVRGGRKVGGEGPQAPERPAGTANDEQVG